MGKRRYPGVLPFTSSQKNIFFGRTEDIKKLKKLILLRDQILMYSKSGIGKTSLLNAGIFPELEDKFAPLHIRFTAYNEEDFIAPTNKIVETLFHFLKEALNIEFDQIQTLDIDKLFAENGLEKNLWFYFKKIQLARIMSKKFILVFDQFEELFTYPESLIADFKEQLADLTRVLIPDNLINEINSSISDFDKQDETIEIFSEKPELKTVFAIRSDRLSYLNLLADKIPDIQEVFYELKPLTEDQVKEAIINPAMELAEIFDSPGFKLSDNALEKIISELSYKHKQSIETTQLQIVCQQIEEIAKEKKTNSFGNSIIKIELNDLPSFDAIFYHFYEQSVAKLVSEIQDKARILIEDLLIRNMIRISLDENICIDYLNKEQLNTLVSTHLLRAERNSIGGFSYEISHDTLVGPISEARKKRIEKVEEALTQLENEQKLRLLQEQAERERLQREKEKVENEKAREKQRKIIVLVGSVALIALIALLFSILMYNEADKSKKEAEMAKYKAILMADFFTPDTVKTLSLKYPYFMEIARKYYRESDYIKAKQFFIMAQNDMPNPKHLNALIGHCDKLPALIKQADTNLMQNNLLKAKAIYLKVLKTNKTDRHCINRLNIINFIRLNGLVFVKGGTFTMGSDASKNEYLHKVSLNNFFIGKTEVTNLLFAGFLNKYKGHKIKEGSNKGQEMIFLKGSFRSEKCRIYLEDEIYKVEKGFEKYPVIFVTWQGANEFCKFYDLSLPSEAQWEYAARGGVKSINFPSQLYAGTSNEKELDEYAWFSGNNQPFGVKVVSSKKPNALGLYDMTGNVWEWCLDMYKSDFYKNPTNLAEIPLDPINETEGTYHVFRGGSWYSLSKKCTVSARTFWYPIDQFGYMGFRIALAF